MYRITFLLFLLLPATGFSQYVITGRVISSADKTPVASASVFLNNTVAGSKSDEKGHYIITNVRPGQYDLVVTCVGYEMSHQSVMVNADLNLADIVLNPKIMMLQEVKVKSNSNWKADYERFKTYFFGESPFAGKCKIVNKDLPDMLDLDYNRSTGVFTAKSTDFLVIENKALGYRIRYFLNTLKGDSRTSSFYFEGTAAFEELAGSASQKAKWRQNRLQAYEGSSMHFLRSAVANTLTNEGFKVMRVIVKRDTSRGTFSPQGFRTLVDLPLNVNDFVKPTTVVGEYALTFKDCLYVMYAKKRARRGSSPTKEWARHGWDNALITTLIFNEQYAFFDDNGIIINPQSVTFDGNWGHRLTADLLPQDYVPQ